LRKKWFTMALRETWIVGDIDMKVSQMIRTDELDIEASAEMSDRFSMEVSKKLDDAKNDLASELNLKVKA
jgi:hypothetical protein